MYEGDRPTRRARAEGEGVIRVYLRTGKRLVYNDANQLKFESGAWKILQEDKGSNYWRACFPAEVVERVDFVDPCLRGVEKRVGKNGRQRWEVRS